MAGARALEFIHAAVPLGSLLAVSDPGVRPNDDGLPGLSVLKQIVGAPLVISVIVWALGRAIVKTCG